MLCRTGNADAHISNCSKQGTRYAAALCDILQVVVVASENGDFAEPVAVEEAMLGHPGEPRIQSLRSEAKARHPSQALLGWPGAAGREARAMTQWAAVRTWRRLRREPVQEQPGHLCSTRAAKDICKAKDIRLCPCLSLSNHNKCSLGLFAVKCVNYSKETVHAPSN